MHFNLAVILRETAGASPERPAAVYAGGQMTYGELDALSDRLATALERSGLQPGDVVGLQLPNIPQFLISYFGILKAGGVVVPLNVMLKAPEVAFHLGDCRAKVLITWEGILRDAAKGATEAGVKEIYAVGHSASLQRDRRDDGVASGPRRETPPTVAHAAGTVPPAAQAPSETEDAGDGAPGDGEVFREPQGAGETEDAPAETRSATYHTANAMRQTANAVRWIADAVDSAATAVRGSAEPTEPFPFEWLLAAAPDGHRLARRRATDTAVIVYTSGTTGRPKGAELTHIQLYMNADIPGRLFDVRPDDVVITVLPLFHVFGLSSIVNVCVRFGCAMSLVPRFDPVAVLTAIQRDRATIFEGVPTMFISLLSHPGLDSYDVSSLRVAISGGASIPAPVLDAFEKHFGVVILEGYGLTETASTTTFNRSITDRRVYSVGKPIWGTQTQVWGEDGHPLPAGEDNVGEVVTRGLHVMKGYLNKPEATADVFTDGWFHTGDLGYIDDDGFLFIVGRKKELIIRGGYNVYPGEIEDALHSHPAIAEAAVVGIPDERLGEEVMAAVTLRPGKSLTAPELIAYCKERLAAYKYPRVIEFRDELPRNALGKILKDELAGGDHTAPER